MKTIEETYREKLQILIAEYGTQAALARKIDKNPAQISQWLNGVAGASGKPRSLRAETAREIERKTGKPLGWFDQPVVISNQIHANHNTGTGTQNNINGTQYNNFLPDKDEPTHTMPDNSMAPVLPYGAQLWIDGGQAVQDGKIYLIEWGGLQLIRRLYRRPNQTLRISADNKEYGDDTVEADEVQIKGRVLRWCVND